jgi:gluconokinase
VIIIVTGVLGAGKTTIGSLLAQELGFPFYDADSFHSPANIEKMRRGIPLNDADREPWLEAMHKAIVEWLANGQNAVLACSALKRSYRAKLVVDPAIKLVYLKASYEYILNRLNLRHGHFAGGNLLLSQFADLEEPTDAVVVDATCSPREVVEAIRGEL